MSKKSIISGAIILTVAGIITRLLGFVYRVFLSNAIGAEGMGLYQLIMPVYALAWSIACSGFTTTISKLTAQENAKGEQGNIKRLLWQAVAITTTIGIIISFVLYVFAEPIAVSIFRDMRAVMPIQILSLAIPFMAFGSCLRGYFFGLQETMIPAINQVFEQTVRMAVVFLLAGFFIPLGLEYAAALAVIGIVAEEAVSLLYIITAYNRHKKKRPAYGKKTMPSMSFSKSFMLLCGMALPLTATRVAGSLLGTFENFLIPRRLELYGMTSSEAISTFGQISGMAMPLIYFPSAILTSLAISLIPAVSEATAIKNFNRIKYTASRSMLFSSVIGFCAAAVFITFSHELGDVIYSQDISEMLILLGIMSPFLYMQVVLAGILNGLGCQVFIFRNSLISSVINIAFVYFLVPQYGINAFILGWFVSLIVTCGFEINKLGEMVKLTFEFKNWFVKPIFAAVMASLAAKFLENNIITPMIGQTLGLAASIGFLAGIYLVFILLTGCLRKEDIVCVLRIK